MKKFVSGIMAGIILALCVSVFAQNAEIIIEKLPLKYIFNGVEKTPVEGEEGFIYNDRTYVPIRFISESLGKEVLWNEKNYSISIFDDNTEVIMDDSNRRDSIMYTIFKQETDLTSCKWYPKLLEEMECSKERFVVYPIGLYENYAIVLAVGEKESGEFERIYRCDMSGDGVEYVSDFQTFVGGLNYDVTDKYCAYIIKDEETKDTYFEIKNIETLETTAKLYNSSDENFIEDYVFYISDENDKYELREMNLETGKITVIKELPDKATLKVFREGKNLNMICTDAYGEEIYYYDNQVW